MRRAILLVAATFVAVLLTASVALAQSSTMGGSTMMQSGSGGGSTMMQSGSSMGGSTMMSSGGSSMGGSTMMSSGGSSMGGSTMMTSGKGKKGQLKDTSGTGLPTSGGPALLLPAAALLLGSGILTFAVLRRR